MQTALLFERPPYLCHSSRLERAFSRTYLKGNCPRSHFRGHGWFGWLPGTVSWTPRCVCGNGCTSPIKKKKKNEYYYLVIKWHTLKVVTFTYLPVSKFSTFESRKVPTELTLKAATVITKAVGTQNDYSECVSITISDYRRRDCGRLVWSWMPFRMKTVQCANPKWQCRTFVLQRGGTEVPCVF